MIIPNEPTSPPRSSHCSRRWVLAGKRGVGSATGAEHRTDHGRSSALESRGRERKSGYSHPTHGRGSLRAGVLTSCCTVGVACAPNRASLMTGRYPNAHRLRVNGVKMPEDEVTLTHAYWRRILYRPNGQAALLASQRRQEPSRAVSFLWVHHQLRNTRTNRAATTTPMACGSTRRGQRSAARLESSCLPVTAPRSTTTLSPAMKTPRTRTGWRAKPPTSSARTKTGPSSYTPASYAPHPPLNPPASMLALYKTPSCRRGFSREDETSHLPPIMRKAVMSLAATPEDLGRLIARTSTRWVSELDRNIGRIVDSVAWPGSPDAPFSL